LHELSVRQKSVSLSGLRPGSPGPEPLDRTPRIYGQESMAEEAAPIVPSEPFIPLQPEPEPVGAAVDPPAEAPAPNEPTESPAQARTEAAAEASRNEGSPAETGPSPGAPNEPTGGAIEPQPAAATGPSATVSQRPLTAGELFDLQRRLGGYV
jgi:hypothetical protein